MNSELIQYNNTFNANSLFTLNESDIAYLSDIFLTNGELNILSIKEINQYPYNDIMQFCLSRGIHCLPTLELIDFLKDEIGIQRLGKIAIEIGAGHGAIAQALNIISTDSFQQNDLNIKAFYAKSKQPTVKYGKGIHKLDADEAIDKFTPSTIIGAFITHKYNKEHCLTEGNMYGVAEEKIIEKGIKYIFIGNKSTHQKKYICKAYPNFKTYQFDWLFAKVKNQHDNVIWVWN